MSVAVVDMIPFRRRMMSRDPSLPKPRACRNLFGTPDPEEVNQMLTSELRKFEEEDRRKYNFDFMNDSPIDGKYEWQTVDPQDIPAFYGPVTVASGRKSLPERTPSIPLASEAGPVSVQSTSVDATVPNMVPANLQARLHGDASPPSSSSDSPSRTVLTTLTHKDSKTPTTSSCAINSTKTKSVKKNTQSCRRRRRSPPLSPANQPKITDMFRVKKRSSPMEAAGDSKRRKEDQSSTTTTQSSTESIATSSS